MGQSELGSFLVRRLVTTEDMGDRTEDRGNDWVLIALALVTGTMSHGVPALHFFVDEGIEPAMERLAEEFSNSGEPSSTSCYQ